MEGRRVQTVNIAVCVKPVPDPSIVSLDEGDCLDPESLVYAVNFRDWLAVGEAVRLKARDGVEGITVLSIADPSKEHLLRRCLALGADKAIRLWDSSFENPAYSHRTGMVLAKAARRLGANLVLCGQKASDDQMGFTGYAIAEFLGIPFIQKVVQMDLSGNGKLDAIIKLDGGKRERVEANLPLVVGVERGSGETPYADLPALLNALRAPIETYDNQILEMTSLEQEIELTCSGMSPPWKPPSRLFKPDSDLPAEKRLQLIMSGGIVEKKKELLEGSPKDTSLELCHFLRQSGFLD